MDKEQNLLKDRVPTGFVEFGSPRDDSFTTLEECEQEVAAGTFAKLPVTLYTDTSGINIFVLELGGKTYVLPVGTD